MSYSYFEAEGFEGRNAAEASAQFSDARRPSWKWSSCRESRSSELPHHSSLVHVLFRVYFGIVYVLTFASGRFSGLSMLVHSEALSVFPESCWEGVARLLAARSQNPTKIEQGFVHLFGWDTCGICDWFTEDKVEDDHTVADGFYSLGSSESAAEAPVLLLLLLLLNWFVGAAELSNAPLQSRRTAAVLWITAFRCEPKWWFLRLVSPPWLPRRCCLQNLDPREEKNERRTGKSK